MSLTTTTHILMWRTFPCLPCLLWCLVLTLGERAVDKVTYANCQFAFDLYQEVAHTAGGRNAVLSPLSVSTALSLSYLGASHGSRKELGEVLHYTGLPGVHVSNLQLLEALRDPSNNYTLDVASAAFISNRYQVSPEYRAAAARFYRAAVLQLDFVSQRQNATDTINAWVREATQDRVRALFHAGALSSNLVLLVVNAVYFRGWWKYDFEPRETRQGQFRLNEQEMQQVDFMQQTGRFHYWSSPELDARVLELPYVGDEVRLYILLPNTVLGIYHLEQALDYDTFRTATSRANRQAGLLTLYLPKVKLQVKVNLKDTLYKLGLKDSFMPSADLSGIGPNLYLTDMVHQASIEFDEEGTTGAAAVGIQIMLAGPTPDSEFRVDHPFMFLIQDKVTDNILFMGRMMRSPEEGAEIGEFNPDLLLDTACSLTITWVLAVLCWTISLQWTISL